MSRRAELLEELENAGDAIGRLKRSKPRTLVEVARDPRRRESLWWSDPVQRIYAIVRDDTARIERRWGNVLGGDGVRLDRAQLRRVLRACAHWSRVRESFAAFFGVGMPGGYGGTDYYQPPGDGDLVTVGELRMGRRVGGELVGREELVRHAAKAVASGIVSTASIWRRGEKHGPKAGSLVGARWKVGDVTIDVRREEATVACGRGRVVIEHDEIAFARGLVRVIGAGARLPMVGCTARRATPTRRR